MSITRKLLKSTTFSIAILWLIPVFAIIGTIGTYQYLNEKMDIKNIMTALYIFAQLQGLISFLPICINCLIETFIALKRIEVFFLLYLIFSFV